LFKVAHNSGAFWAPIFIDVPDESLRVHFSEFGAWLGLHGYPAHFGSGGAVVAFAISWGIVLAVHHNRYEFSYRLWSGKGGHAGSKDIGYFSEPTL
jgi:hypothetical protein